MSNPQQSEQAGGEKKTKSLSLSIIIEGSNKTLVADVIRIVADRLQKQKIEVLTDKDLSSNDERVLIANQKLLDVAAITLAPETSTLFVAVKLQPRLRLIQVAKSRGITAVQSMSWLGDAVYYEAIGNMPVVDNIFRDFKDLRPDVWAVIDVPGSSYSRLAKRANIAFYKSDRSAASIASSILEQMTRHVSSKPKERTPQNAAAPMLSHTYSRLAQVLIQAHSSIQLKEQEPKQKVNYYRPDHLGSKIVGAYETIMNKIVSNYEEALRRVAKYGETKKDSETDVVKAVRSMLPLSATVDSVSTTARATLPPEKDAVVTRHSKELTTFAESLMSQNLDAATTTEPQLLVAYPANELDLLSSIVYPFGNDPESVIQFQLGKLSYDQKQQAFVEYIKTSSSALRRAQYTFDIVTEFNILETVMSSGSFTSLGLQQFTPRYGYDTPEIIEKAGAMELYQQSFDLSMELYSLLQAAGYPDEAQYAVLGGHRVRFELVINGLDLVQLRRLDSTPEFRSFINQLVQAVSARHPLFASTIKK